MKTETATSDVDIYHDSSVVLFTLNTDSAREWVEENVHLESWQWAGTKSFAVDTRFAKDLADGMVAAGLDIQ